ncbi:hypothetical protein CAPTEDRAFT_215021 [Capitella teleta]|uniref:Integrase core domain-containing protein n=1 Tax=Capitella teleta TaxID=283909 RepID=R7TM39_CAPTE|nr:hypothetical protein CAPTEDRAFT_215021 [Capitella teleta]|eukprot:ELT92160.1 hypothetical protein CAPTEDRAFT_215021 [Capitella teleta]
MESEEKDEFIELLFGFSLCQSDILRCLAQHGCNISDRRLRRILAKKKLCRRKFSDIDDVASFVNNDLKDSGQQHGYRFMWQKLKDNGLNARNDDVRVIIRCLDPEGVVFRGCSRIVRGDAGTENVNVERIQVHLMGNGRNGCRTTYIKSKSTSNQRIECFWGQLRKQCAEYWIVLLSTLEDKWNFEADFVDKSLCQFCFVGQLQNELDAMLLSWNNHVIRKTRRGLPSGRPSVMYEFPSLYGVRSYQTDIRSGELENHEILCFCELAFPVTICFNFIVIP